jgi:hypothetical protein
LLLVELGKLNRVSIIHNFVTYVRVTSAWWVPYSQIQRREAIYDVQGKKNFLPPATLVLGYAILWTTEDEGTMDRHVRPQLSGSIELINEELANNDLALEGPDFDERTEINSNQADLETVVQEEDKYNLGDYGSASDDDADVQVQQILEHSSVTSKRYLSVKQRRDLKKGKSLEPRVLEEGSEASDLDEVSPLAEPTPKSKVVPKIRGKRGKLKKMKERYADQSDEERELAQKILGGLSAAPKPEVPAVAIAELPVTRKEPPASALRLLKPIVDEPLEVLGI